MRGYLEDRVTRLESSAHGKMTRAELISWCWALVPLIVGAALLISLVVTARVSARSGRRGRWRPGETWSTDDQLRTWDHGLA